MGEFRCPFCQSNLPPLVKEQVSATGWVVFAVLLISCLPLCWIPFVVSGLQEEVRRCAGCGTRLG